jgi:exosome complex RNA-binding protein Rrp42 (RNase PH superfamily)
MLNYSQNERDFFRTALFDFNIRLDGRTKLAMREYEITENVLPSCLSSLKLSYNDKQNEILFAIKGEIIPGKSHEKLLLVSLDSMGRIEDQKIRKELETYLETLLLSHIGNDLLRINKNFDDYSWRLYVDIYAFDYIRMSLLQLLFIGVRNLIINLKVPRLVIFTNEITGYKEFDLIEAYHDVSENEKEMLLFDSLILPDIFVFAILKDAILLDPNEEEFTIASSIVIVSSHKEKIINVQSIGSSVDVNKLHEISILVKSFN